MLDTVFTSLLESLKAVLPLSPFKEFLSTFAGIPALGYLNWFFPVRECLGIMSVWLTAVGLFYMYSIVMRWIKVIGD